jgi:hypothetical protein
MRNVGYSKRGKIAKTNWYFFQRGVKYSVLGPFVLDDGFLDISIVEGAFDADRYFYALEQSVVSAPEAAARGCMLLASFTPWLFARRLRSFRT